MSSNRNLHVAAVGLMLTVTAEAHHSPAAYDASSPVTFEGVLTAVAWNNPHVYLELEVKGADGTSRRQQIEAAPVAALLPLGASRDALKIGERVVVRAAPHRAGAGRTAFGLDQTAADGTIVPLSTIGRGLRIPAPVSAESLTGTWMGAVDTFVPFIENVRSMPLNDAGRRLMLEAQTSAAAADCIPAPPPLLMIYPIAMQVEVGDDAITISSDWMNATRTIYLGDREPSAQRAPTLLGHSAGRWEDGTLVVETVAFTPSADQLPPGGAGKRLTERFTLSDDGTHVSYEATVEDPQYLREPYTIRARWDHRPDLEPSGLECDPEIARRFLEDE